MEKINMEKIIINAENVILGRLASFAAKKAMQGYGVEIVNSEKAIITGSKEVILEKYKRKRRMGDPHHGPFFPREPNLMVRRTIRGMIPHKQAKGRDAYKKVKCFVGIPEELKDNVFLNLENFQLRNSTIKHLKVGNLTKLLGSKHGS